jgi:hypothetical protein
MGVEIITPNLPTNMIETYWKKDVIDLSRGMDFSPRGKILAKFTHLNHRDFQMRITVGCNFCHQIIFLIIACMMTTQHVGPVLGAKELLFFLFAPERCISANLLL